MLSKRLAGLLKQQYRPEVVFLTAEILLQNDTSVYLERGLLPGLDQLEADLRWTAEEGNELDAWRRARGDAVRSPEADLESFLQMELEKGRWYDDKDLTRHYRTEIMTPWVARQVNRWLKRLAQLPEEAPHDPVAAGRWPPELRPEGSKVEEHYEELRKIARNVGSVSDYLHANCTDAAKLTLNQLLHRSRRWHAAMTRKRAIEETPPSPLVFEEDPGYRDVPSGELEVYLLDTPEALKWEGNFMKHCVAGYWQQVERGDTEIYSVREKGRSVATIEVQVLFPPDTGRGHDAAGYPLPPPYEERRSVQMEEPLRGVAVQIKGQANRQVNKPPICEVIQDFLLHYGFANESGTCLLPGDLRFGARGDPDFYRAIPGWKAGEPAWRSWWVSAPSRT